MQNYKANFILWDSNIHIAHFTHQLALPVSKKSESIVKEEKTLHVPQSSSGDGSSVSVAGVSVDDIVSRVLKSTELEALITSISSQNTAKSQSASEDIHLIVK